MKQTAIDLPTMYLWVMGYSGKIHASSTYSDK